MYDYQATVLEWHDGDTVKLRIDEGFGNSITCWVRVIGAYAPELKEPGGPEAKAYVESICPVNSTVYVLTRKPGSGNGDFQGKQLGQSFARWLGQVYTSAAGADLAEILVATGHATRNQ